MSWKLSETISKTLIGNPLAKEVLRCLADFADKDGYDCFPSIAAIACRLERDKKTIYKAMKYLKNHGWIESKRRKNNSCWYKINKEKLDNAPKITKEDWTESSPKKGSSKLGNTENGAVKNGSSYAIIQKYMVQDIPLSVSWNYRNWEFGTTENGSQNIPKTEDYSVNTHSNTHATTLPKESEINQEKSQDSELAYYLVEQKSLNLASEKSQHSGIAGNPTSSNGTTFPEVEELFNVKSSPYTKESALDSENALASEPAEEKNSAGSTVVNDLNVQPCSNEIFSFYTKAPSLNNSDNANGTTLQPVENPAIQQTPSCVRETDNTPNNSDNYGASPTTSQTTTVTCTTEDKESASESNEPPSCVKGDSSQSNHETLWTGTSVEELALCDNLFGFEDEPSTPVKSKKSKNHKCAYDGSYELLHPKTKKMVRIEADFVRVEKPEEVEEQVWNDFIAYRRKKSKTAYITENVIENYREISEQSDFSLESIIQNCIDRDWQGIKSADWLIDKPPKPKGYTGEFRFWRDLCIHCNKKNKPLTKSRIDDLVKTIELYKVPLNKAIEFCAKKGFAVFVYTEYLKWLAEEEGKKVQTNFTSFNPKVDNSEKGFFGKFSSVGA